VKAALFIGKSVHLDQAGTTDHSVDFTSDRMHTSLHRQVSQLPYIYLYQFTSLRARSGKLAPVWYNRCRRDFLFLLDPAFSIIITLSIVPDHAVDLMRKVSGNTSDKQMVPLHPEQLSDQAAAKSCAHQSLVYTQLGRFCSDPPG
jgi:hypothetical protein